MEEIKRIKKTFYVDSELVKLIKIKSAMDENTETDTMNFILSDYFSKHKNEYSFSQKKK